jgi:hypothetical protein
MPSRTPSVLPSQAPSVKPSVAPSSSPSDQPTPTLVAPNVDPRDEQIVADDEDGLQVSHRGLIGGMAAVVTMVMAGLYYQYRKNELEMAEEAEGTA